MSGWFKLLLGVAVIGSLLAAALFVQWLFSPPGAVGLPSCIETRPLTPVEDPGHWWERHRRFLTLPASAVEDGEAYVLWNTRTGHIFEVNRENNPEIWDGRAHFGVHTRYALFVNRRWRSDPWLLCVVGRVPDFT